MQKFGVVVAPFFIKKKNKPKLVLSQTFDKSVFCVRCRNHTRSVTNRVEILILSNNRVAARCVCAECKGVKYTFVSESLLKS